VFQAASGSAVLDQIPAALRPVVPIVVGALRDRVESGVEAVLSSDAGKTLVERAVHDAHAAAMRILQGDGLLSNDAFSITNGTVTLDRRALIRQVVVAVSPVRRATPRRNHGAGRHHQWSNARAPARRAAARSSTRRPSRFPRRSTPRTPAASKPTKIGSGSRYGAPARATGSA